MRIGLFWRVIFPLTISHHWESSTITGKSLSNKGDFRMLDPSSYYGFTNPMAWGSNNWSIRDLPFLIVCLFGMVKLTDWRTNEALEEGRLSDWLILWLMVPMDNTTWNSHQKLRTVSRQVKVRIWGLPLHDRWLPPHFPILNSNRLYPSAGVISDCWTLFQWKLSILGKLRIMDSVSKMDFRSFEGSAPRRYSYLFSFDSTFNTLMVCRWDRLVFMNLWSAQKSVICRRCKNNLELYRTLERSNVAIDSDHPIPTKMDLPIRTKIIYLDRCSFNVFFGNA